MNNLVYFDGNVYREEDFLAHYGVKGMKWGVRRSNPKIKGNPNYKSKRTERREKRVDKIDEKIGNIKSNRSVRKAVLNKKKEYLEADRDISRYRDKKKSVGLTKEDKEKRAKAKDKVTDYDMGRKAAAHLTVAAASFGASKILSTPKGRQRVAQGVAAAGKYSGKAYRAAKSAGAAAKVARTAAKNFNSGTYINEAGKRVFANPNFRNFTTNTTQRAINRSARALTR